MKSIYIHIPFCKKKCLYCDFNSYDNKSELMEKYIKALQLEMAKYGLVDIDTIYIGGGTPSVINSQWIVSILESLPSARETTIEINPGTITREKLLDYKKAGINRISIGLQTTNDSILKEIGRVHSFEDFKNAYTMIREVGFDNVNVDLMFGLPKQTLEDFQKSVAFLLTIQPEHISAYSLILHDTIFENLPSEEEEREMYHYLVNTLKENGYHHYEISNFAKLGNESKHNLVYWNQKEYYGFGAGASSFLGNKRYTNVTSIEEYIKRVQQGEEVRVLEEILDEEKKLNEYMMLKLRLMDGVRIQEANELFHTDVLKKYQTSLEKLCRMGLINIDENIYLTQKGLDLANWVWEEFV